MVWGNNGDGQLGFPRGQRDTRAEADSPMIVRLPSDCKGTRIVAVAVGSGHSLLLTNEGEVVAFGRGDDGRLGLNIQEWVTEPSVVAAWEGLGGKSGGRPEGAGAAGQGQGARMAGPGPGGAPTHTQQHQQATGTSSTASSSPPPPAPPLQAAAPRIGLIAAGSYHSAAVGMDGQLYTWGGA